MPCYDGREEEDRKRAERHRSAMTAMLCGVMRADRQAVSLARIWCGYHNQVDTMRSQVKWDHEEPRIRVQLDNCDRIMDQAYLALCVNTDPHSYTTSGSGEC